MSYTSFNFFLFVAAVMVCYFCFPWKQQKWIVLLVASYTFYLLAGYRYAAFILFTTTCIYAAALVIERISEQSAQVLAVNKQVWDKNQKKNYKRKIKQQKRSVLTLTLVINFGILIFLKYANMFIGSLNDLLGVFHISFSVPTLRLFLPLGISFYTFQSLGYLIDVYHEKTKAEHNIAKFALFVSFFPQIIQGPISIYDQLAGQLYEPHDFSFTRFKHAAELILWGTFKKLVIADRAVIAISAATSDYTAWNGTTLTFVILLYALQLYADFSGGVDISRGISQIFGIQMIDNFRQPYFATSISEYWHRWHISLGQWFRTYLFYPLALSKTFLAAGKKIKNSRIGTSKTGQHIAKVLPTSFASFLVFFLVGIWHGPNWKYVAFGIWNGGIIMISVLLEPQYVLWAEKLKINTNCFAFRIFQIFRTLLIVLIGYVFDVAPNLSESMRTFVKILTDQSISTGFQQIGLLSLEIRHYVLILVSAVVLFLVSLYHECTGNQSIREKLDELPFWVRYLLILSCLLFVLYYGVWGPGYAPADFVYMQF